MSEERKKLLQEHLKHEEKHGKPLLSATELANLQGRIKDDEHAIDSYKKGITAHYSGYISTQGVLELLNGSSQRESAHYDHEVRRHAETLAQKCASFNHFCEGSYVQFTKALKEEGIDIKKTLKEIKTKYGYEFLKV